METATINMKAEDLSRIHKSKNYDNNIRIRNNNERREKAKKERENKRRAGWRMEDEMKKPKLVGEITRMKKKHGAQILRN